MGDIPIDIIIYAAIAGVLLFMLRGVLGTRHGEEIERPNPFAGTAPDLADDAVKPETTKEDLQKIQPNMGASIEAAIVQISLMDRHFEMARFLDNAKDAFAIVVTAFGDADRETLKDLLADDVYKSFDAEITKREKAEQKAIVEVQAVRSAEIIDAELKKSVALITLRIKADETYVLNDKDGKVVTGHPDKIISMTDVWVFSRDLKSNDPRWFVVETRDDVAEENARTIPDAGGYA